MSICVFSADLQKCCNQRLVGSSLTCCKSEFLTVWDPCQSVVRWDIGIVRCRIHCTSCLLLSVLNTNILAPSHRTSCGPTYCFGSFPVFIVPAGHTLTVNAFAASSKVRVSRCGLHQTELKLTRTLSPGCSRNSMAAFGHFSESWLLCSLERPCFLERHHNPDPQSVAQTKNHVHSNSGVSAIGRLCTSLVLWPRPIGLRLLLSDGN